MSARITGTSHHGGGGIFTRIIFLPKEANIMDEKHDDKFIELHKMIVATIAVVGRQEVVKFLRAEAADIESWMKNARKAKVVPGFF